MLLATARQLLKVERKSQVAELMHGSSVDAWRAYELSWLNELGKPCIGVMDLFIPYAACYRLKPSSLQAYLHQLAMMKFTDARCLIEKITEDVSAVTHEYVQVSLMLPEKFTLQIIDELEGYCLDHFSFPEESATLTVDKSILVYENLYTHALRYQCTDSESLGWASLSIRYEGPQIIASSLWHYILSLRTQKMTPEQCADKIFLDLLKYCQPQVLTVEIFSNRRFGVEINPIRSTQWVAMPSQLRLIRQ